MRVEARGERRRKEYWLTAISLYNHTSSQTRCPGVPRAQCPAIMQFFYAELSVASRTKLFKTLA